MAAAAARPVAAAHTVALAARNDAPVVPAASAALGGAAADGGAAAGHVASQGGAPAAAAGVTVPLAAVGLAAVADVIEELDGTISVTSSPGKGTCMQFEVPLNHASLPTDADSVQSGQTI
mgnify:CR=1 FL=1